MSDKCDYEHWSNKKADNLHTAFLVPQTIYDSWELYCSCNNYSCAKSFYEFSTKETLIAALHKEHAKHRAEFITD